MLLVLWYRFTVNYEQDMFSVKQILSIKSAKFTMRVLISVFTHLLQKSKFSIK